MAIYTVRMRTTTHIEAESAEEAGDLARSFMMRGWSNMALGAKEIVRSDDREFVVVKVRATRKIHGQVDETDEALYSHARAQ